MMRISSQQLVEQSRKQMPRLVGMFGGLAICALFNAPANAAVTVGLHFVQGENQVIDFLTIHPDYPSMMEPWQMTAAGTNFVSDGAFQGISEQEAREAIFLAIRRKFFEVQTPDGYILDIDFSPNKLQHAGSVNVLIGKLASDGPSWFGNAMIGGGLGNINGEVNAAVSVDRIDNLLKENFTQYDHPINAVANVIAHEVGHLFNMEHVWADERQDLGWQPGDVVVSNPYDVLATASTGLPDAGWIQDNPFSTVAGTQAGGSSSAQMLIQQLGLKRQGDFDSDQVVGNSDIGVVFGNFGVASGAWYADGDTDADGAVGNSDIGTVFGNFGTSSAAGNLTDSGSLADLRYDPVTGNVTLDASEAAGGVITNYVLKNADGTFIFANWNPVLPGSFDTVNGFEISESDGTGAGVDGLLDLGNIFGAGLTQAQLEALLIQARYVGELGSGVQTLDLIVVPEPSSLAILFLAGLGALRRKRA